ncbi:MAG TPA: Arm DNA-binding domain-containing protein [Ideonella sp.]|uniref:Arm DNA-binding domain-containing protein n=1 Tax=Ideonella sp. TaxID=1929293 RepID=UPI002E357BDC|nr:Arm DNA-binding domain-containing protein [Ideonella sp.]HEX5687385.1 Arm DNA-binding domain-containing protein [Ideonella sp.]
MVNGRSKHPCGFPPHIQVTPAHHPRVHGFPKKSVRVRKGLENQRSRPFSCPGSCHEILYLLLFVKGGAHGWRLACAVNGVRTTLSLGTYPHTGLGLARKKASEARKLVSDGIDPSDVRKAAEASAQSQREAQKLEDKGPPAGSFEAVARE